MPPEICKRSHLRTKESIYVYPNGRSECRPCRNERSNERQKSKMGVRSCSVDECDRGSYGLDLCKMHYDRKRRTGTTDLVDRLGPKFPCGCKRSEENTYTDRTSNVVLCRAHRLLRAKDWKAKNRERVAKKMTEWRHNNPNKVREYQRTRRARKMLAEHVPYGGLLGVYERDGGLCAYCGIETLLGVPSTQANQATVDHVIPLVAGGADINENVVLACRLCNSRKTYMVWEVA